jgi:hypothetical protein
LSADDANFPDAGLGVGEEQGVYRVSVEKSEQTFITQLKQLGEELRRRVDVPDRRLQGGHAAVEVVSFKGHLYEPLIKASGASITVKPVSLNEGEMRFVKRLKDYCTEDSDQFADKPLLLLRNMSRGRGVGFFEAGNFYPDFILWRIHGDRQRIVFVDPKGLHNLSWEGEPKLEFYKTVQEIEQRMSDPNVSLRSFIISVTPAAAMKLRWPMVTADEMARRNILFDEDEGYIERLVKETLPD